MIARVWCAVALTSLAVAADLPERRVTVGAGAWALEGTLTIPAKGQAPYPAVVLLHDAGPHDQDETIGANKPFRDLARGLATRGIAVLRYEKRTERYRDKLAAADLTPKEEVLDDAAAALQLLNGEAGIDPKRIFVAGHGLGGKLAPWIARHVPGVAGIALLAAPARDFADVLAEQIAYLRAQAENQTPEALEKISAIEAAIERLRKISAADSGFLLGAPVAYWLWWSKYDALKEARQVSQPVFVVQAGRDYEATGADFELWRQAFPPGPRVTFKSYADLNHLFQPGKGRSKPEEYEKAGKMANNFLNDLAAWINTH